MIYVQDPALKTVVADRKGRINEESSDEFTYGECPDCKIPIKVPACDDEPGSIAVCPNCGHTEYTD